MVYLSWSSGFLSYLSTNFFSSLEAILAIGLILPFCGIAFCADSFVMEDIIPSMIGLVVATGLAVIVAVVVCPSVAK